FQRQARGRGRPARRGRRKRQCGGRRCGREISSNLPIARESRVLWRLWGMVPSPATARRKAVSQTNAAAFRLNNAGCACYLLAVPDFLLELFSEEIPARMQARAAEDCTNSSPTPSSPAAPPTY